MEYIIYRHKHMERKKEVIARSISQSDMYPRQQSIASRFTKETCKGLQENNQDQQSSIHREARDDHQIYHQTMLLPFW